MTFDDYEHLAARTRNPALDEREALADAAAGLAEEAGEVLGAVRKHLFAGHHLDHDQLRRELGDALWCLAMTARSAGLTLEEVAGTNIEKLRARYPEGFTAGASRDARPSA